MKKVLLFIAVFSFTTLAFSQSKSKSKFGIRLGGAYTDYYGADYKKLRDTDSTIEGKWSPSGGFYINTMVSDYFWVKTEFNFVNRGGRWSENDKSLKQNLYYLDLYPATLAFHIKGAQLFAGPSVGILMAGNYQRLENGEVKTINYTQDDMDNQNMNRLDFGLVAGVEYEFNFGLNAGVRYLRGFSSYLISESGTPRFDMFNKALVFSVGFTIGRGKSNSSSGNNYGD